MPLRRIAVYYLPVRIAIHVPGVNYPCITAPFATCSRYCYPKLVRLACLIHAANVRSEPGSNPSIIVLRHSGPRRTPVEFELLQAAAQIRPKSRPEFCPKSRFEVANSTIDSLELTLRTLAGPVLQERVLAESAVHALAWLVIGATELSKIDFIRDWLHRIAGPSLMLEGRRRFGGRSRFEHPSVTGTHS
jgi:hypothetical protein